MAAGFLAPPAAGLMSPTVAGLVAFLALLAAQRAYELRLSLRNGRRLVAAGGRLIAEPVYPWIVVLHVAWPVALAIEVLAGHSRPSAIWPFWLVLYALAEVLRQASMVALGTRWSTRVWDLHGAPPVRTGPYRLLRHPNYVAVIIELLAAPMLFGAWRTALAAGLVNLLLLWRRLRLEERMLAVAAR